MTTGYMRHTHKLELNIRYWEIYAPAFELGIPGTCDIMGIMGDYTRYAFDLRDLQMAAADPTGDPVPCQR
jgi:hypothetical protein